MRLVMSVLVGVLGMTIRLTASAEMAGFKMHPIGITLVLLGVAGVVVALLPFFRSGGRHPLAAE